MSRKVKSILNDRIRVSNSWIFSPIRCCRALRSSVDSDQSGVETFGVGVGVGAATSSSNPPHFDVFFNDAEPIEIGDVAHGWVELDVRQPCRVNSIGVAFYGEATFDLFGKSQRRQFEQRQYELWRRPRKCPKAAVAAESDAVQPGLYVYEFFVGTHAGLPAPFEPEESGGAVRSVVYYCEVTVGQAVTDSSTVRHVKRKALRLKPTYKPVDALAAPVCEKALMRVRNLLDLSGCIAATVTLLDGRHYRPGQNVSFRLELLNCFRRLKVDVELIQKAKACLDGAFQPVRFVLAKRRLGVLSTSDTYRRFTSALWIPDPAVAPVHIGLVYGDRLVQVGFAFVVTVATCWRQKLVIDVPLVVQQLPTSVDKSYATL